MRKSIFLTLLVFLLCALAPALIFSDASHKLKAGVVLAGCGIQDGTEVSEAVLTMLYLEREKTEIIFIAPDIEQASVVNHYDPSQKTSETRNVLVESARISRGQIKDIKQVKAQDLDILIIAGGLGVASNLCDLFSKGKDFTVNPDLEKLINDMYDLKKVMGFMCISPMIAAKTLGKYGVKLTLGKDEGDFVSIMNSLGAKPVECSVDRIVVDEQNRIVSTPAFMLGPSTSDIAVGIEKLVKKVVHMGKRKY